MKHKNIISLILGIATIAAGCIYVLKVSPGKITSIESKLFCYDDRDKFSEFHEDSPKATTTTSILNSDGTIKYFYDNFAAYANNSFIISDFEDVNRMQVSSNAKITASSEKTISGKKSLKIQTSKSSTSQKIVIQQNFDKNIDISTFANSGVVTAWIYVLDRHNIQDVSVKFIDANGNTRMFTPLDNNQSNIPNFYDKDDAYPDIPYKYQQSSSDEWTDYWLNQGWNFLFWRNDKDFYTDSGDVDFHAISKVEISLSIPQGETDTTLYIDDLRLVSGLQKEDNPLSPNWFPPNGRPQYGLFDVDSDGVKLLNVRQNQYLSNGDHGRMITKGLTPENFIFRARFTIEDLGANGDLKNTWLRLMYDFDPDYDPGHDWFGFFDSFEYKQVGLITVIPIQRFYLQDQEPSADVAAQNNTSFKMKNNETYEVQMKVEGQNAEVWIYSADSDCLQLKEHFAYSFSRPRRIQRYPFALEITGDVKATISEVEISQTQQ